jgi:hypothetical protein
MVSARCRLIEIKRVSSACLTSRVFALCSPGQPGGNIKVASGLSYVPVRVAESEPEAPVRAIHGEMRHAEESLSRDLALDEYRLVVVDGPLTFEETTRGSAVGYMKRVIKPYLGPSQLSLLPSLKPGQRTPSSQCAVRNAFPESHGFFV